MTHAISRTLLACILGAFLALVSTANAQRNCNSIPVPECREQIARDIVFLLDASDSLETNRFYTSMLNYVQSLWCATNPAFQNRGTVITFSREIKVRIPFQVYTAPQWFAQVETLRTDTTLCCSCCTPTAEAFSLARTLLTQNRLPGDRSTIIFTITDGDPWQNPTRTTGTIWPWPQYPAAKYRYELVPKQAALLKSAIPDLRIMLVGIPNKALTPPNVNYFAGIPDPTKYPSGVTSGRRQCLRRGRRTDCSIIKFPPFPIVSQPVARNLFSTSVWSVRDLVNQTASSLCVIRETSAPTRSPTETVRFEGLDVYMFIDRSRSMQWHADLCRRAPGANLNAIPARVCWQLFMKFAQTVVANATNIRYPTPQSPRFGWQANRTKLSQGVRVWMYGFACTDGQSVPVVDIIGEKIDSQAAFDEAMTRALQITPTGGTCPSAAFERSMGMIMGNDLTQRPYKTAILITDGVFYDVPRPSVSMKGFGHFGIFTYAVGIAIPEAGDNNGLKPGEIALQRSQLLEFAQNETDRVGNLGEDGFNLLDDIANGIVNRLPAYVDATYPLVIDRPYFCGFTNNERCLNTNETTFKTAQFCKWIPNDWNNFEGNGRCMDKQWCGWPTRTKCEKDRFCNWSQGKCVFDRARG